MNVFEGNQQWMNRYFHTLRSMRRYSLHTLVAYQSDIKYFVQFLNENHYTLEAVNRHVIRRYLREAKKKRHLSHNSLGRAVASLRQWFHFLYEEGALRKNPMVLFKGYRKINKLPDFLYQTKVADVLGFLEAMPCEDHYLSMRERMIVELLYGLGLRISELKNLHIKDIFLSSEVVKIHGKGTYIRYLPLTQRLQGIMPTFLQKREAFLRSSQKEAHRDEGALFLNQNAQPLSIRGIRYVFNKIFLKMPFEVKIHPHGLRHSIATHLMENACDMSKIRDFLGHKSLNATQVYTHVTKEHLRKTIERYHPYSQK